MVPPSSAYVSDVLSGSRVSSSPTQLSSNRGFWDVTPGFRDDLLKIAAQAHSGWRWPQYQEWFQNGQVLETAASKSLWSPVLKSVEALLPAAFIEWRYFAILTPGFHGIVGLALFNPQQKVSRLAEGGMLCLVAGTLKGESEHFCWHHLFPTQTLHFSGPGHTQLEAHWEGCHLTVNQISACEAEVSIAGSQAPHVRFHHKGLAGASLHPFLAEDLKRVPGSHWIVHNPSPIAHVQGHIKIPAHVIAATGLQEQGHYPNFSSAGLHTWAEKKHRHFEQDISGSGYYEHSFGCNPMPLNGWDFLFIPDHQREQGIVMQTYARSQQLRFIEVLWTEKGERKYTRFSDEEFSLNWKEKELHPHIGADVPRHRTIKGKKGGYTLEIENTISHQLPFLRRKKLIVRHFFISEEIGRSTWSLKNAQGTEVAGSGPAGCLSGGEVAYPRIYWPH
jgi:hypothetical protein